MLERVGNVDNGFTHRARGNWRFRSLREKGDFGVSLLKARGNVDNGFTAAYYFFTNP
jgi:hypothetical protein